MPVLPAYSILASITLILLKCYDVKIAAFVVIALSFSILASAWFWNYFMDDPGSLLGGAIAILVLWLSGLVMLFNGGNGRHLLYTIAACSLLALSPFVPVILTSLLSTGTVAVDADDGWRMANSLFALAGLFVFLALSPVLLKYLNRLHCNPW